MRSRFFLVFVGIAVIGTAITLILKPGISNMSGFQLGQGEEISFTVAPSPKVVNCTPGRNETRVQLYHTIEISMDKVMDYASLKVTEIGENKLIPGVTKVIGNKVSFQPFSCYLPGKTYRVSLNGESREHESMDEYVYNFTTIDMGDRYWVEVNLGSLHTMTVYRGNKVVRKMLASGGKSSTPTPVGYFYTQDRGASFWSPRFGEGATYWVRLVGQILIHSVPKDNMWKTKEDEHEKLGLPASHGCVRLSEKDAKWFYENIRGRTLVIIHK